ncbi:MAG: class II aldolase/adducin family protein [Bacteroidota bacterium]
MKQSLVVLKNNIIDAGKRAYARGYVASNDGNISARINKKHILITPTGISKGFMKMSDLIVVDMNGKIVNGKKKPSSEVFMHLQIYHERPDVNSVCHMHPPYATGFAVAGIPLDQDVLSEAVIALGKVPLVEYGTPGSEELYSKLLPHLRDSDAFLLANHGALTVGTDVFDAYNKMETLEHAARIIFIAKQLGNVNTLNAEQVQKLAALREKFGIKTDIAFPPVKK